jgi:hypothetical protein
LLLALAAVLCAALGAITLFSGKRLAATTSADVDEYRETWRMPTVALLTRPLHSRVRLLALWSMRGYLFIAVALLLVKALELATSR